jgi:hypothetical protein
MTNEKVVLAAICTGKGPKWSQVPRQMRDIPEIVAAAFKYNKIELHDVPYHLRYTHPQVALLCLKKSFIAADDCTCFDAKFLRQAINQKELPWTQLPTNLQTDISFAKSISSDIDDKRFVKCWRVFPLSAMTLHSGEVKTIRRC